MAQKTKSEFCNVCGTQKLFAAEKPSHILHLLLCLVTGGLWLFIWIPLLLKPLKYRCSNCGSYSGAKTQTPPAKESTLVNLAVILCLFAAIFGTAFYFALK